MKNPLIYRLFIAILSFLKLFLMFDNMLILFEVNLNLRTFKLINIF